MVARSSKLRTGETQYIEEGAGGLRVRGISSGSPVVSMMQSTESIVRNNAPGVCGTNPPRRRSLPSSEMRAVLVVIANIVKQKSPQMAFVHRNNVIQQLPPSSGSHQPA